jgi:hypothetical protein
VPDPEWICFRVLRILPPLVVPFSVGYTVSTFSNLSFSRSRARFVGRFQDGSRTPSPLLEFFIVSTPQIIGFPLKLPIFPRHPQSSAMAASPNVQLSLQIQRSLQAQVHSVDNILAQQTSPSPTTSDFSEVSVSLAPPVETFGPPAPSLLPPPNVQSHFSGISAPYSSRSPSEIVIAHPYARLYAKKNATGTKRRKIWNHALEKSVFNAHEMSVGFIDA